MVNIAVWLKNDNTESVSEKSLSMYTLGYWL